MSISDSARPATRSALPEGTISVGIGLVITGIAAYLFLAVATRAVGEDPFLSLSQLWFVTFIVAPGFFLPIEQEVGRALAHRKALGEGSVPLVRRAAILAGGLATITVVLILALSPVITRELFHGSWALLGCLLLSFLAYAAGHLARGILSGSGDFNRYGLFMGADGILRVLFCGVLAIGGVKAVGWYGLCVGVPPVIAVALAIRGRRNLLTPGPEAEWNELTPNLGWLLFGSLLSATLVNAGPLAANLLADEAEKNLASRFAKGVLVARVPLFLFQAVQAALLPKLARLAAQGAYDEFRAGFRKLMLVVLGVCVLGTVGAAAIGPFAVDLAFDAELGRRTLTLLALASGLYMVAMAIAQALIALHGHAQVAWGWAIGMAAFFVVTAIAGNDLLLRVELGLVAASVGALLFFAYALRGHLRSGAQPDAASLLEALHEVPLEP
ncbi:MAG: lipopolysaccharide biosynthesis protein [Acidimicrobiia bacterium]